MVKLSFLLVVAPLAMFLGSNADAMIIELSAEPWRPYDSRLATQLLSWNFDNVTQVLTLSQAFYRVPNDLDYWDMPIMRNIQVSGYAQGPSTFTIIENISNMTTIPWTSYELVFGADHSDDITSFVLGSATSDHFSEVSDELPVVFSNGVVLPGETLTIQYEIFTNSPIVGRGTNFVVYGTPIPEPGTIIVLSCGAALIRRNRRKYQITDVEK